jgi:hypothetical protein
LTVILGGGQEVTVPGWLSVPFGVYRGTEDAPSPYLGRHRHTLVHLPGKRIIATLRTHRQAQALACELAPVFARGDPPLDPGGIIERHSREAK